MKYSSAPSPMIGPTTPWKFSSGNGDLALNFSSSLPQPLLAIWMPWRLVWGKVIAGFHWLGSFWAWKMVKEICLEYSVGSLLGPFACPVRSGIPLGVFPWCPDIGYISSIFSWSLPILTSIPLRAYNDLMSYICIPWKYKLSPKYQLHSLEVQAYPKVPDCRGAQQAVAFFSTWKFPGEASDLSLQSS